ncbi:membrane hypothetical protein [Pseudomonas brassicacearum]
MEGKRRFLEAPPVGASLLAIAVFQSQGWLICHSHREQARSHNGSVSHILQGLATIGVDISVSILARFRPIRFRLEAGTEGVVIVLMMMLLIDLSGAALGLVRSGRADWLGARRLVRDLGVDGRIVTGGRCLRLALLLGGCGIVVHGHLVHGRAGWMTGLEHSKVTRRLRFHLFAAPRSAAQHTPHHPGQRVRAVGFAQ